MHIVGEKMLTLDQIKAELADRKIEAVAEATRLHRNTIARIRDGESKNPTYYVLSRLSEYLTKKTSD